ncbi:hypothetical protein ASF40_20035 [Microbacterium sp. Leaf288]|uniref:RelA/SpoT domain-containing protein n=1 Tax=Microbacterium sp. Leaf288 TaxID=1736323 RepID=UPI0006F7C657|nr:RelA/SpoT domain-containing protein [Microbacterium sp. Leaf288]KQP67823.1 hypothetical protein ASF40_20035 [Microbacterium sp. Leaf288]
MTLVAWEELRYSKNAVRKAGELIGQGNGTLDEIDDARTKLSNFRSSHGYPLLSITMHVRGNAIAVKPDAVVARRLKRLPTILDKLERYPRMNVTTMQDLGGCRVILSTVAQVDAVVRRLENAGRAQNTIVRKYDYLRDAPGPQSSGYRGVHLVYEYRATKKAYHGHKVEVQIRTELQHAWATAVETMDLFGGGRLKYSEADPGIARYFLVVSSLMALDEELTQPTEAALDIERLRGELAALEVEHAVLQRLSGFTAVVESFGPQMRNSTLVMELFRDKGELYVSRFDTVGEAQERLASLEARNDENIDAVLIGMTKFDQLQAAYPNYFANTTAFSNFVNGMLNGYMPERAVRWQ